VIIEGETGTGKELAARALHFHSPRRGKPFRAVNCAALSDELVESELFGHGRGAFTGAVSARVGLLEEVNGGTLFLDEIADLSLRAQAKVLRVIEDGAVRRVGENSSRTVDVRFVSASNRSLQAAVRQGTFRADLLFRLNVIHIFLPPLRDRREDIPLLARAFWENAASKVGSRATLRPETVAALMSQDWPGNVRELQNAMRALTVRAPRRGRIGPEEAGLNHPAREHIVSLPDAKRAFEKDLVERVLAVTVKHVVHQAAFWSRDQGAA
jgi:DNA-binding NtrC family response regulator